jgi:hypothetical protein
MGRTGYHRAEPGGSGAAQGPIMRRLGLAQAVTLVSLSSCESGKGDRDPPGKKNQGESHGQDGAARGPWAG